MKIHKIDTGNFKLDGGAMFGVVPKSLWNKVYPADENNMCNLSLRLLLVEEGERKILFDTGVGNKQDKKFFSYYYLNGTDTFEESLEKASVTKEQITDVVLSHLHFDHCGGAVEYNESRKLVPAFKNAVYWCSSKQWEWAIKPNQREKASYLKENIMPLQEHGKLKFFEDNFNLTPSIKIKLFNGHTDGLAVSFIKYNDKTIIYVADLIPTAAHIPSSWVCGFDTKPLISFEERDRFLLEAYQNNFILFFEHDIYTECCTLQKTEKGIRMKEAFTLSDIL